MRRGFIGVLASLAILAGGCGGGGGGGGPTTAAPESTVRTTDVIFSTSTGISYNLNVYLPAGYSASTARYPVIYAADAESRFAHASATLESQKRPVILVAISAMGAAQRWTDFTMPGAERYYRFLTEELIPRIDGQYRTNPADRTYNGHSLTGAFAIYAICMEKPDRRYFRAFISEEGSFWYDAGMRIGSALGTEPAKQMESDMFSRNRSLPVTLAMSGDHQGNAARVRELYDYLAGRGYADLTITHRGYNLGHVGMDALAFADALDDVFGPVSR